MNQTVKRSDRELLPSKPCTSCGEHFDSDRLTWVGGQWFCPECHLQWKAESEPPQLAQAITAEEEEVPVQAHLESLDRMDSIFHLGSGFLRFGGYGIGIYMGTIYEFAAQFLHGVLLADVLSWIALCWFDARFNKLPVILEFIGFVVLTTIVLGSENSTVFETGAGMGMAFLGFLITIGTKGVYQLHKHWTSGTSEAE